MYKLRGVLAVITLWSIMALVVFAPEVAAAITILACIAALSVLAYIIASK